MSHHTVSGVTTIAVFIVMRCATIWMTVEMEVMRKRKTVSQKKEGKTKDPKLSAITLHRLMIYLFLKMRLGHSQARVINC